MLKSVFISFLFIIITVSLEAQVPKYNPLFFKETPDSVRIAVYRLSELGAHHYDETWNAGNIYLTNGDSLLGYYIRYDIVRNSLEIILDKAFQSLNKSQIARFEWFSADRLKVEHFTSREILGFESEKMLTYFPEILEQGTVMLLKMKELISRRSANSPLLINNDTENVVVKDQLYYYRNGEITEVSGSRNRNFDFFACPRIESFVRDNNLNFSNEGDVKRAVRFYNTECQ